MSISSKYRNRIAKAFQILTAVYLILFVSQEIWSKSLLRHLNMAYVLVAVIQLGICALFTSNGKGTREKYGTKDYALITLLGIVAAFIIDTNTNAGWLSHVLAIIAGCIIILLGYLVLHDK